MIDAALKLVLLIVLLPLAAIIVGAVAIALIALMLIAGEWVRDGVVVPARHACGWWWARACRRP